MQPLTEFLFLCWPWCDALMCVAVLYKYKCNSKFLDASLTAGPYSVGEQSSHDLVIPIVCFSKWERKRKNADRICDTWLIEVQNWI